MLIIQAPGALFFHGLTAPKSHQPRTPAGPDSVPAPIFIRQGGPRPMNYFF